MVEPSLTYCANGSCISPLPIDAVTQSAEEPLLFYQKHLHVTLYSALQNLVDDVFTRIYFFHQGYQREDIDKLNETLYRFKGSYELICCDVNTREFDGFRGLHRNVMPYLLIQIPDWINSERVIYLDADLLVLTDLSQLFYTDLEDKTIAVVANGRISHCLEAEFFVSLGMNRNSPYFNTGVVLIDTEKWKARSFSETALDFCKKYANNLLTADQTVMNYLFHTDHLGLPTKYNFPCYPTSPCFDYKVEGIYHFVGSPKPWDLFGEVIHRNYPNFQKVLSETAFRSYKSYRNLSVNSIKRAARLSRSYFKAITAR